MTREKKTDSNGSETIKNYAWDHKDRMAEAQVVANSNALSTVLFSYDSGVRRLEKSVTDIATTETTQYPFADYEITKEGKTKVSISANNMHLSTVETDQGVREMIFSHGDHLGGSNVLTDINAAQVQTIDYFPFGKTRIDEQYTGFDETKKFTGHELDDETGLYYAQARYYDPEIGRFVGEDPLGFRIQDLLKKFSQDPQVFNFYSYSKNNPIKMVDPTGEAATYYLAWKGAVQIAKMAGLKYTAQFLNNAIPKLSLGNFFWPEGKGMTTGLSFGANSELSRDIQDTKTYSDVVDNIKAEISSTGSMEGLGDARFNSDTETDFAFSIGTFNYSYAATQNEDGSYDLDIGISDLYNFDEFRSYESGSSVGNTANDLGYIFQEVGELQNFNVNIQINDTITLNKEDDDKRD